MEEDMFFDGPALPFTIGDVVPAELDFPIYHNGDIAEMSFEALRGKWVVLMFYPKDFTFVCPTELAEMASLYGQFTKEGAEIVSVSTDTPEVHKAWHDVSPAIKTITFPMAADPSHLLAELFGVLIEDEGITCRATFIISPDGVVKSIEMNDNSIGRNAKETLRKLKAAKYVANNPTKVCPASWNEGDDTLTPGVDLVGKI